MKNRKGTVRAIQEGTFSYAEDFVTESGRVLPGIDIAYEIYGRMNADKSNAILICHPLTADAHAAGWHEGDRKPGWWDIAIGPGKAFDTDQFCVISSNVLGGCSGSTGPASIHPTTGRPWATDFPIVTIGDMVRAQKLLIDDLGITRLFAVAGGSMGGMQVLQWAVSYPEMVRRVVAIATTASSGPQQIAFNAIGRRAVTDDPEWKDGHYYGVAFPKKGLSLARMIGHTTYLSSESMYEKFGRDTLLAQKDEPDLSPDFQVESYLDYQGGSFTGRFDANAYLYITKAVDLFDLSTNNTLSEGLSPVRAKCLVISITSDWLYPPSESKEIVSALLENGVEAEYAEIRSHYGHDAFLIEGGQLNYIIGRFLSRICSKDVMYTPVVTIEKNATIEAASAVLIRRGINHLPVTDASGRLSGIVTSWDIAKAVACRLERLEEIITTDVVCTAPEESIEQATEKMTKNSISALPVVDADNRVLGIITSEGLSRLLGRY